MVAVRYFEFPPSARLAPFVRCYWILEGGAEDEGSRNRIFPDGSMELVFQLAEPFRQAGRGQDRAVLIGQQWAPVEVTAQRRSECVGVRFHPGGALPFLRFSQAEVAGTLVSLDSIWGARAPALWQRLGEAATRRQKVAVLELFLLSMAPEPAPRPGQLSPRQQRRRFEREVGIPPKLFARIRRFQRALKAVLQSPAAVAAVDCGYYDQAHLNHDFREFAGITPKTWIRERDGVLFLQDPGAGAGVE